MEQIIYMPVHFFVSPQMPFYTAFQVILSAPYIDIKTLPESQSYPDIQPVYYAF